MSVKYSVIVIKEAHKVIGYHALVMYSILIRVGYRAWIDDEEVDWSTVSCITSRSCIMQTSALTYYRDAASSNDRPCPLLPSTHFAKDEHDERNG